MNKPVAFDFCSSNIAPGLTVIEASAGTGKTYAISHLVPRLLLEGTVKDLSQVVLVTFTNDAAGELSDRVRRVLGLLAQDAAPDEASKDAGIALLRERFLTNQEARVSLQRAVRNIDLLTVCTIHSFCQRVLQTEGPLCGLPSMPELVPDAGALVEEAVHDLWQRHLTSDPFLAQLLTQQKWSPKEDTSLVRTLLSLESPEFFPPSEPWQDYLEQLQTRLSTLHPALLETATALQAAKLLKPTAQKRLDSSPELSGLLTRTTLSALEAPALLQWLISLESELSTAKGKEAAIVEFRNTPSYRTCAEAFERLQQANWQWSLFCAQSAVHWIREKLKDERLITYDGIIGALHKALNTTGTGEELRARLASRHLVGLIDESQDTDARQFSIFSELFLKGGPEHRLVLIGDPKQSIYAFRGADVSTYLAARNRPDVQLYTLGTTYRSPTPLVEAVNAFFLRPGSLLNEQMSFYPASSGLKEDQVLKLKGEPKEARVEAWLVPASQNEDYSNATKRLDQISSRVAGEIKRLLQQGALETRFEANGTSASETTARPVTAGDIAVLVAKTKEAEAVARALQALSIPAVLSSGATIMASEEAADLHLILKSLLNPRHSGLRYAALATRLLGKNSEEIRTLRNDPHSEDLERRRFDSWLSLWENKGVAAVIARIDTDFAVISRLGSGLFADRSITNFRHLTELLQTTQRSRSLKPAALLAWFSLELAQAASADGSDEERQLRLESDSHAVQIVTMHKAKGLEYNLVFCPFLWSPTPDFPLRVVRPGCGQAEWVVNTALLPADAAQHDLLQRLDFEDRIRLAYVALTRAKIRAWIYCGAIGSGVRKPVKASALDWLLRAETSEHSSADDFAAWKYRCDNSGSKANPCRSAVHQQALEQLQTLAPERISIVPPPEPWNQETDALPTAQESSTVFKSLIPPAIPASWSLTSFSGLTKEKHAHDSSQPLQPSHQTQATEEAYPRCNLFLEAPAGAAVGTALHEWIETWDFGALDEEALSQHLSNHGLLGDPALEPSMHTRCVDLLTQLAQAQLPGLGCTLAEACPVPHASEWHFYLPIRDQLSLKRLADIFRAYTEGPLASYADRLEAMPPAALNGLLQGFIDRLAFKDDAWGVIDWKTNRLGTDSSAYTQEGLLQCAMNEHYVLQTHLYLVALRRHLRRLGRQQSSAGAWLVFLRAVSAQSTEGVLHLNPPEHVLEELDTLFA